MSRNTWCAMALAVAMLPAYGQDVGEELRQLQQRIQQLEKRLQETENVAAQASARPAGENAFNPAVSVILQGTAARSSLDPNTYRITGFAPPTGEIGPARRGFSLGESELFMTANIDPYFRGQLVASLTPEDTVEVEEAFFQTLGLGKGFTIKMTMVCSCAGWRRPICSSSSEPSSAKGGLSRALRRTRMAPAYGPPSPMSAATSARAPRGAPDCLTCALRRRIAPFQIWTRSARNPSPAAAISGSPTSS